MPQCAGVVHTRRKAPKYGPIQCRRCVVLSRGHPKLDTGPPTQEIEAGTQAEVVQNIDGIGRQVQPMSSIGNMERKIPPYSVDQTCKVYFKVQISDKMCTNGSDHEYKCNVRSRTSKSNVFRPTGLLLG